MGSFSANRKRECSAKTQVTWPNYIPGCRSAEVSDGKGADMVTMCTRLLNDCSCLLKLTSVVSFRRRLHSLLAFCG